MISLKRSPLSCSPHICILAILLTSGCVYYNTLYNAKDYYERATQSTPANKDFLDKSIQKCEKIVEYHPHSKHIPEALFLIGRCFLAKEEYEHAVRKFEELIAYYPEHELADASRLELGRTYLGKGDYFDARQALEEANKDKGEAAKLIMESYFFQGDYEKTISIGKEFVDTFLKSDLRVKVFTTMGDAYDSLGQYESALKSYEDALNISTQRFQLVLSISDMLISLDRYEDALERLVPLRELADVSEKTELELVIAKCYRAKGESQEALETLKALESSPEAQYDLGLIYEEDFKDLEKAKECYEEARRSQNPEIAKQALVRASRIGKLAEYRDQTQDSTDVDSLAKTQFLLAELYWAEFDEIDNAMSEYEELIQDFPESDYAAKSAYSIGWLFENKRNDTTKAVVAYERVQTEFPDTRYAKKAKKRLAELKLSEEGAGDQ
jgi:tetratricopeptide (TPR) repeat protein